MILIMKIKVKTIPLAYVRWTEKRNFNAILKAISNKSIDVKPLITQHVPIDNYLDIYSNMKSSDAIASILEYSSSPDNATTVVISDQKHFTKSKGVVGIIGAGNFTGMTLLPILKKTNAEIKYITSSKGLSGTSLAKKYGISRSTTNYSDVLEDPEVDIIVITTQHNLHSDMVIDRS